MYIATGFSLIIIIPGVNPYGSRMTRSQIGNNPVPSDEKERTARCTVENKYLEFLFGFYALQGSGRSDIFMKSSEGSLILMVLGVTMSLECSKEGEFRVSGRVNRPDKYRLGT